MKTLLFLIDDWSSAAGGIQTVNRELCLALGRYKKTLATPWFDVMCVAKRCTSAEREEAAQSEVMLLEAELAEAASSTDPRILRTIFHSKFSVYPSRVVCVVGHSRFTGMAANTVRAQHFPTAKLITVCHMDVDVDEGIKGAYDTEWEVRFRLEVEVAASADIVLAVGPRLKRSIQSSLTPQGPGSPTVHELLCGINERAGLRSALPLIPTFLFRGRADQPAVKGVDLFVRAAGRLVRWWHQEWRHVSNDEPRFIIRGLPADAAQRALTMLRLQEQANSAAGGRRVTLIPRSFSTHERELADETLPRICRRHAISS